MGYMYTFYVVPVMTNFVTLWTVAHQAPLSMGFSRQAYRSGLPCPSQGDLLEPGTSYVSCTGRWVLFHQRHLGSSHRGYIFPVQRP